MNEKKFGQEKNNKKEKEKINVREKFIDKYFDEINFSKEKERKVIATTSYLEALKAVKKTEEPTKDIEALINKADPEIIKEAKKFIKACQKEGI